MPSTRQNLLVGIFVLVGLGALGTLVVLFGSGPARVLGGVGFPLVIEFETASGIRPGNAITLRGIQIGRVQDVRIAPPAPGEPGLGRFVEVVARIDEAYRGKIPANCEAVTTEPVLGQGRPPIELVPLPGPVTAMLGERPEQEPDRIKGRLRGPVEQFVPEEVRLIFERTARSVHDAADSLTPVLDDLHQILQPRTPAEVDHPGGPPGNLSSAMARLDHTLKHFNEVLGDPDTKSQIREAVANFHAISEDGKVLAANLRESSEKARQLIDDAQTLVEDTRGTVQHIDTRLDQVCRQAEDTLQTGSRLLDALYVSAAAIRDGEGTLGHMVHDTKLYDALVFTVERLGQAVEEFRLLVKDWQKGKIRVAF